MIENFENYVLERLHDWYEHNGNNFPVNVLYYRDGVSDSQYDAVMTKEVDRIQGAFEEMGNILNKKVKAPKITAVIVTKRHNTRFYSASKEQAMPDNENCKPGTIVDSVVTSPYYTDFFLQSHNGINGTARPAHYFVLKNKMDLTTPALQNFVSISFGLPDELANHGQYRRTNCATRT
jgi:eukaryotic translation initiation factor 2C